MTRTDNHVSAALRGPAVDDNSMDARNGKETRGARAVDKARIEAVTEYVSEKTFLRRRRTTRTAGVVRLSK